MAIITPSIPVSQIVSVTSSVLEAANVGLVFNGMLATQDTRVPAGTVERFSSATDVSKYFGATHKLTALAQIYFAGYYNSYIKPQRLLIAQWPLTAVSAYLRGGDVTSGGLTALQAINGTLTVSVDGTPASGTVNLSGATSFSNAATLIGTAISETVTYDSVSGGFIIHSATTGATSTIAYATGSAAAALKLTSATGAVLSQGSDAQDAATFLDGIASLSQGWVSFSTDWEPDDDIKLAAAAWFNDQNQRYVYVMYDSDASDKGSSTASPSVQGVIDDTYDGIFMLYTDNTIDTLGGELAAFTMGSIASVDLRRLNGRVTFAFRRQTGLPAMVKTASEAQNLSDHFMNYYGSWSEADDEYIFLYPGQITGPFKWLDSYLNQLWIASQLRTSMINLLMNAGSIPYNKDGYALIEAAAQDVIFQAVDFGAIRTGIVLSETEKGIVNSQAGIDIDKTITSKGWYFLVQDPAASIRAARGSPVCTLWYADGESVQRIDLASIAIQ